MSDIRDRAREIVRRVVSLAEREGKLTGFCIGNTSKIDGGGLFFSPIRNTQQVVAGSVIVYRSEHAAEIARAVDGAVAYIFVDVEKKAGPSPEVYGPDHLGNIERAVRDVVRKSTVLVFKGNDLTVDSIDCMLSQLSSDVHRGLGGKKVAIFGAGNLGSKLALKLVERGAHVVITRRDEEKLKTIVAALNIIRPARTAAMVSGSTDNEAAARGADLLIGVTSGTPVVTAAMIESAAEGAVVMDGGKGCLFPDAIRAAERRGLRMLRVDVRAGFEGQVAMLLAMERFVKSGFGRRKFGGVDIVSGGLLARAEEIVVDDVGRPRMAYGIADGLGDFLRNPSPEQKLKFDKVQAMIDGKTED